MELRHIWQILWKRRWIVIQSFVIVTLIPVVGSEFLPEVYQARAKIWVPEETGQSALLSLFGLRALSQTYPHMIPLKEEMRNRRIMATLFPVYEEVVWNLQIRDSEGNLISPRWLMGKWLFFIVNPHPVVEVNMTRETAFLTVTSLSTEPEEAQMLANAMADCYMQANEEMLRGESQMGRAFARKQMNEVSELYDRALDEFLAFQEREGTVDLSMETQIAIQRVTDLIKDRERTILTISETESKLAESEQQLDVQTIALWTEASGTTSGDPELTRLSGEWTRLKIRLRNLLIEKTENHPLVDILRKEVENVEEELRNRLELYEDFSPLVVGYKRDLVSLQAHLEGVEKDIEFHMDVLSELPEKSLKTARLSLKTESYRKIYSSLLDYDQRLGLAEVISLEDVKIVEKASLPGGPVLPDKTKNGVLGMVFGLMIGLALAFLVEHLDERFIVPGDVREWEALPLLGVVPLISRRKVSPYNTKGRAFESYRDIRHNLKSVLGGRTPRSFVVLSPASGEGRSLTAANIALSFCREGKRVVLLDADLRGPSQHSIFGTERSPGVEEVVLGKASIDEALKDTEIEGLKLLPAGGPSGDPAIRVESKEMARLVEELEGRFDVVVADTPPLLCVTDGAVIAGLMEMSVLVYESRRTTEKMAEAAKHVLELSRVVPAGVILNKLRADRFAFKSYGYEKS